MSAYPQLSFVVTTAKTKGSAGSASGLVSEINAHTARNAHARRRIAKDRAIKIASTTRKRYVVAASKNEPPALCAVAKDVKIDTNDDTEQACWYERMMSPSNSTRDPLRCTSVQIEFSYIDASLKSMVCLPLACSRKDVTLIQFYLTYGRRMQLGTSETPKYDPGIDVMQRLIEVSPLYTLVHIVISQHLLSGIMQEKMPLDSYKYQAEAYRVMNNRINDTTIPVAHKIFDLIQLTMLEFSLGRRKQSILHLEALESFVTTHGGVGIFLDPSDSSILSIEPRFYMGMFLRVHLPITTFVDLQRMLEEMLGHFERVRKWLGLQRQYRLESRDFLGNNSSRDLETATLLPLRKYLERFGRKSSFKEPLDKAAPPCAQAYICSWMICMTLVEHDVRGYDAITLLHEIQAYMQGSCEESQDAANPFASLFVGTVINTISHVRRNRFPNRSSEELRICQAGVTALRCYWVADEYYKKILARKLCACIFSSIEDCSEDKLAPSFITDLHNIVVDNWLDSE